MHLIFSEFNRLFDEHEAETYLMTKSQLIRYGKLMKMLFQTNMYLHHDKYKYNSKST